MKTLGVILLRPDQNGQAGGDNSLLAWSDEAREKTEETCSWCNALPGCSYPPFVIDLVHVAAERDIGDQAIMLSNPCQQTMCEIRGRLGGSGRRKYLVHVSTSEC